MLPSIHSVSELETGKAFLELSDKTKKEERSLCPFDAIILATARAYFSKVLTADEHFTALPEITLI